MINKRHHFVPQYYLKQFRADETNRILVCLVDPYRCVGLGAIKGQCKSDHFYGKDGLTDALLQETERQIAPVLYATNKSEVASTEQWQALRLLAVQLHLRTNKATELAKVFPRFAADQFISAAIKKGDLPPPKGGWQANMMDFDGVPQTLIGLNLLSCFFETATLRYKILRAPPGHFFITSDHPSVTLNQFASDAQSVRDYVGFAQSGFQLVLPLGPSTCAFLYDPCVYKVGNRRDEIVLLEPQDVEILNSLQVQSAENCVYAHTQEMESKVRQLVARYARLRKPTTAGLKMFPQNDHETLVMSSSLPPVLPNRWRFCGYCRNIRCNVGDRRDPGMTHLIQLLIEDMEADPRAIELPDRLEKIVARQPADTPIIALRRPELLGVRLPTTPKEWKTGMQ
ncbi:MAG TPA: DUF4238 domain-containing protein [Opitutus sp.]|nr:DUF4238 domain-containing protein [Opitutus sp.]